MNSRVLYTDRVFAGNLTTQITETDLLDFLWNLGFEPTDAKIIRDHSGVSKGYGFVNMRCDDVGEKQTQHLLAKKTFNFNNRLIIFKPAYRKSMKSKSSDPEVTKVISSSEVFDSDVEEDGSTDSGPSSPPTTPVMCPCCAFPTDSLRAYLHYQSESASVYPSFPSFLPFQNTAGYQNMLVPAPFPTQQYPYSYFTSYPAVPTVSVPPVPVTSPEYNTSVPVPVSTSTLHPYWNN